ncbi:hypothetical protein MKX03_004744 [Papaver bracteatum]|nr:hypothetical protein MKX03_004744 [Papaver bracteatum]
MAEIKSFVPPHVLIFPVPAQGHINSMLNFGNLQSRFGQFPGFCFETVPDGLSGDQLDSAGSHSTEDLVNDAFNWIRTERYQTRADGMFGFANDVAEELGIPSISFQTVSACCIWINFCFPKLVENKEDMDRPIRSVPEMESFLRCRDLPSYYRDKEVNSAAHILNTSEDIEAPILSHLRTYWPKLYTVGPLNALLNTLRSSTTAHFSSSLPVSSNASLYAEDQSCITWLDKQPEKSVVYVSFGSVATVSQEQWLEIWYGLVNSSHRFLWVRGPDSLFSKDDEESQLQAELVEATKERGYMVDWSPQEEVLNHPAVGGFFTHSGWNSTLESMVAGVPMVCWPHFGDQQINSRYVCEVWKIGTEMNNDFNRVTVEKLIREMMVDKRDEVMESTVKVAEMAQDSVSRDGSSYRNYEALLDFITKSC